MDKQEQNAAGIGESRLYAGENTAHKEDFSFATLLDRFYMKNYQSKAGTDAPVKAQDFVAGKK